MATEINVKNTSTKKELIESINKLKKSEIVNMINMHNLYNQKINDKNMKNKKNTKNTKILNEELMESSVIVEKKPFKITKKNINKSEFINVYSNNKQYMNVRNTD